MNADSEAVEGIIFDLDGVLADSESLIAEAEISLETLSVTSLRQLATASADKPVGPEASVLKMRTGDVFQRIHELMMMAGGYSAQPYVQEAIRGGWNEPGPCRSPAAATRCRRISSPRRCWACEVRPKRPRTRACSISTPMPAR